MKFVIAPDSFKGTVPASKVCSVIKKVLVQKFPEAKVVSLPMADGGEGTAEAVQRSLNGRSFEFEELSGPFPNDKFSASLIWLTHLSTAVIEMAAINGLYMIPIDERDVLKTSTLGTGELFLQALKKNPVKVIFAIGGSATMDGGIGAAHAVGWRFEDEDGNTLKPIAKNLNKITKVIKPDELHLPEVEVLCDVQNPLYGENGAAYVYGPQKGATAEEQEFNDAGLKNLAEVIKRDFDYDMNFPGAGAAGGLGGGLAFFFGGKLVPGAPAMVHLVNLKHHLKDADWLITGEGAFDRTSLMGKLVSSTLSAADECGVKKAVIAGKVLVDEDVISEYRIDQAIACLPREATEEEVFKNPIENLQKAVEKFVEGV